MSTDKDQNKKNNDMAKASKEKLDAKQLEELHESPDNAVSDKKTNASDHVKAGKTEVKEKTINSTTTKPSGKEDMSKKQQKTASNPKANHQTVNKPPKKAAQTEAKPEQKTSHSPAKTHSHAKTEKKGGGLMTTLALLTGVAGTGIGVYNYDQIRQLSTNNPATAITDQLTAVENKISQLGGQNTDELAKQLTSKLSALSQLTKTNEKKVIERLSAVEQTQNGLSKTLQGDLNKTLDTRLNEVNALLQKIDQIELAQKGITQNLNQVTAAGEAVTAKGMAKQEVGYLLRMANYKIQSEADAEGAAGLLKIAEDKLLLLNEGKIDPMIEAIRQKFIQLQGVKPVDSNTLIGELKQLSGIIPNLTPRPAEASATANDNAEQSGDLFSKVGNIIASGVQYTPNDPSKIDISAETILIEKRLMQADIRTAELAVRSQNGILLAETLNSIRANLDKYFANDDTAKSIRATLADIEQQKLETVLPNLGSLVDQFEQH